MKIQRQEQTFRPVSIVLDCAEEVTLILEALHLARKSFDISTDADSLTAQIHNELVDLNL